jgi:hypothetical protein
MLSPLSEVGGIPTKGRSLADRAYPLFVGAALLCSTECGIGKSSGSAAGSASAGLASGSTSGNAASGGSGGVAISGSSVSGSTAASGSFSGSTTSSGTSAATSGSSAAGGSGAGGAGSGGSKSGASIDGGAAVDGGNGFNGPVFYTAMNDGTLYAYQEGTWALLGKWSGLPITDAARGIDADPATGTIYISHGGAGPASTGAKSPNGGLLAWSVMTNSVVYDVAFTHGVDQISFGGGEVYIPSGEYTSDSNWYYVQASNGMELGSEPGGKNPHDTIYRNTHRYYGGTQDTFLYILGLDASPVTKVGPSPSGTAGVRPFTVNASETRVYVTWSNFRGFSVGDVTTGKLLSTVNFGNNSCGLAAPSHGMSLAPDGSELYVLDTCLNQVKVYDSSDTPQLKAAIQLAHNIQPGQENPCVWDCNRDGWITHSRDGKYVYIGDSGDVIDTATHQPAAYLPNLNNCRHGFIELDWSNGVVVGTPTHVGLGY